MFALAGRQVEVKVERDDRYGRVLGTVSCRGMDVGGMAGAVRPGDRLLREPLPDSGARSAQRTKEHVGLRPGDRSEGLAAAPGFSVVVDAAAQAERVSCAAATRTRAASTATAAVTSRTTAAGRTRSER